MTETDNYTIDMKFRDEWQFRMFREERQVTVANVAGLGRPPSFGVRQQEPRVPDFNGCFLRFQPARNPRMQTMSLTSTEKMGWIPDIPDHRDLHMTFSTTKEASKEIKKSLDFK